MGKRILIVSLADFERRKHEIGKQLVEASKVRLYASHPLGGIQGEIVRLSFAS